LEFRNPNSPVANEIESTQLNLMLGKLTLIDAYKSNPAKLITAQGTEAIDSDKLAILEELTTLDFSLKYSWFLQQISSMQFGANIIFCIQFDFQRENLFAASMEKLSQLRSQDICSVIRIGIQGERAIDNGGVLREWYLIIAETLLDVKQGTFMCMLVN